MHFLQNFYLKILKYDLINKFLYYNTYKIPKLQKIILNFSFKTIDLKKLISSVLTLEWIVGQKNLVIKARKSNILLRIRKGNPVGCKVTLRQFNLYNFFGKIILEILPRIPFFKKIKITQKLKKNAFSYELHNVFIFFELENYYKFLLNLPKLSISIVINTKNKNELLFLLKSFKFRIL